MNDNRRIPITGHWSLITDISLTFKRLPAFSSHGVKAGQGSHAAMASDSDDADAAANRLEAALERIAQAAVRDAAAPAEQSGSADNKEIAMRLDGLIARLRSALGGKAD
jgi:hypothetical protein